MKSLYASVSLTEMASPTNSFGSGKYTVVYEFSRRTLTVLNSFDSY
jgi:hypothetical protein